MPTSTRASTKAATAASTVAATKPKANKAPNAASNKGERAPKTVKDKLKRAKERREQLQSPGENKENEVPSNRFKSLPLECVLKAKSATSEVVDVKGKVSDIVLDAKKHVASDELADLAFLGITGATPGGRKWRSRMKEAVKGVDIKPIAAVGEEVAVE